MFHAAHTQKKNQMKCRKVSSIVTYTQLLVTYCFNSLKTEQENGCVHQVENCNSFSFLSAKEEKLLSQLIQMNKRVCQNNYIKY